MRVCRVPGIRTGAARILRRGLGAQQRAPAPDRVRGGNAQDADRRYDRDGGTWVWTDVSAKEISGGGGSSTPRSTRTVRGAVEMVLLHIWEEELGHCLIGIQYFFVGGRAAAHPGGIDFRKEAWPRQPAQAFTVERIWLGW